jgi:hypothetical protein
MAARKPVVPAKAHSNNQQNAAKKMPAPFVSAGIFIRVRSVAQVIRQHG